MSEEFVDLDIYSDIHDEEGTFRDDIATVDKSGKRKWIYPKMPKGKFYEYRKYVSYLLLVILFGLPWIKVGGKPFVLLNILEGEFIIFNGEFSHSESGMPGIR